MFEGLLSAVGAVAVVVASAFLGARLALQRFYRERWWERKVEAYTRLIEAVWVLHAEADGHVRRYVMEQEGAEPFHSGDRRVLREARAEVEKAAAVGAFFISDEAASIVVDLSRAFAEATPDSSFDALHAEVSATREALSMLREAARRDLAPGGR